MPVITARGVRKRYGRGARAVQALDGVDLDVGAGEAFGLLGRNGAGKTTLVKAFLHLIHADAGEMRILDRAPREPASRRPIGYLPEDHQFPDYRTGEGVLDYYAGLSGVERRTRRRRATELLERVGLADAARKKVRTYSKGMKQRLGIAQTLVHDPRVLFLDEPTDGVDPVGRAHIRRILGHLRDEGKTIFLNSHLLSEVELFCDRVAILERGRIQTTGTVADLTRGESVYVVRTDPLPDPGLQAAIDDVVSAVQAIEEGLEVAVAEAGEIDLVVDLVRKQGFGLRELRLKRQSLEQVFLGVVGGAAQTQADEPPPAAAPETEA